MQRTRTVSGASPRIAAARALTGQQSAGFGGSGFRCTRTSGRTDVGAEADESCTPHRTPRLASLAGSVPLPVGWGLLRVKIRHGSVLGSRAASRRLHRLLEKEGRSRHPSVALTLALNVSAGRPQTGLDRSAGLPSGKGHTANDLTLDWWRSHLRRSPGMWRSSVRDAASASLRVGRVLMTASARDLPSPERRLHGPTGHVRGAALDPAADVARREARSG